MDDYWSIWGDPSKRDISLNNISEWEMKKMIVRGEAVVEEIGNAKGIFRLRDGRWTMLRGAWSGSWPTPEQAREPSVSRSDRIEIFQDTIARCRTDSRLCNAIADSIERQVIYWEQNPVECVEPRFQAPAEVVLSRRRTLEAAGLYAQNTDKRVCALNFASSVTPGGGVTRGAAAQEESICRISTLYPALMDEKTAIPFYQEHRRRIQNGTMGRENSDDCIFTPGVVSFKKDDFVCALLPESAWFTMDMITCAAPDQRYDPGGNSYRPTPEALLDKFTRRIERIFRIAAFHKADVLILGAFGCGAFENDPDIVAKAFETVVSKFRTCFETIEFAVYCRDKESENFRAFRNMVQSLTAADSQRSAIEETYDLDRFVTVQKNTYQKALQEIRSGHKTSHWMWFIFPQLRGLGKSRPSWKYGIQDLGEAQAFMQHPELGKNLVEISQALLELSTDDIRTVLDWPDDIKLRSCMTLFAIASPMEPVFGKVLDKFYQGRRDHRTLHMLKVRR